MKSGTGMKGFSLLYSTHVLFISKEQMNCIFPVTYSSSPLERAYAVLHVHDIFAATSLRRLLIARCLDQRAISLLPDYTPFVVQLGRDRTSQRALNCP